MKYLLLHDVVGAARKALSIERADAKKIEVYFLMWIRKRKGVKSIISTTSFNCAKSDFVLLFFMFPALIVSFTALITFPVYSVISLLTSFLCFYRRDDGILKLGDMLRIRIARLIRSLMADAKPNRA